MTPASSAPAAGPTASPPVHADAIALRNGCFVSTAAYLARFKAEFPRERGVSLTVELRDYDGQHTIAVVSWRGAWWGRDSQLGVFPLGATVAAHPAPERLQAAASAALARQAIREERRGHDPYGKRPATPLSPPERAAMVRDAATLLPHASEFFWIAGDRDDVPLLFFRPDPEWVAVYDPLTGTARARCGAGSPGEIVRAIALRLGYRAELVRRDPAPAPGSRVAAR
ncbi:MAG: hypothetical protein JNL92_16315 [Opitutaceae bacterium]|nr:hypothetical protein [Opitutaceae bacterium]